MAMSTDAFWGEHFCVKLGIFVSNWAFLCRTGHFCVKPCILLSNQAFLCQTSVTQLEVRPRWTTNHEGVVAVTLDRP